MNDVLLVLQLLKHATNCNQPPGYVGLDEAAFNHTAITTNCINTHIFPSLQLAIKCDNEYTY